MSIRYEEEINYLSSINISVCTLKIHLCSLFNRCVEDVMERVIQLKSGDLKVTVSDEKQLDHLLGFAARANPKRGFLFVSKVLGKHIPCSPHAMREVYDHIAELVWVDRLMRDPRAGDQYPSSTLVLGMAETATGLGAGVADSMSRLISGREEWSGHQVVYQHTTRHLLPRETLITFDEAHSHAPDQLVYPPLPHLEKAYFQAERLVLVDDEITSGRTLKQLAEALAKKLSLINQENSKALEEIVLVSIVSWLSEEQKRSLQDQNEYPLRFISLLEGSFSFDPAPGFSPVLPGQVSARQPARDPRVDLGRRGLIFDDQRSSGQSLSSLSPLLERLDLDAPITVIGTGEFAYQPFLLAESLQSEGVDVLYQSTTRSPIIIGEAISESLKVNDEQGEGVSNYLHNPPHTDRQVIIAYESSACATHHQLRDHLIERGHHSTQIHLWIAPELERGV